MIHIFSERILSIEPHSPSLPARGALFRLTAKAHALSSELGIFVDQPSLTEPRQSITHAAPIIPRMTLPIGFCALPLPLAQLSLETVLACGQSFRWFKHALPLNTPMDSTHEYRFALSDRVICLRQTPDAILWRSEPEKDETMEWLNDYFQLDVDLQTLYSDWAKRDTVFDKLVKDRFKGLRMLRQDPWENLVSFICSQNNHISRISKMVQALCTNFGHCAGTLEVPGASEATSQDYFAFPPPSALAAPSTTAKLRALGFGYRAEYIQKTAQMLLEDAMSGYTPCEVGAWSSEDARSKADATAQKILHDLRGKNTEEAREALLRFMGVGRKVADCILLMSLDKREVVPVDTHVYQIAVKHYSYRVPGSPSKGTNGKVPMTPKIYDAVASKFVELWGNWAGWAHSVLFTADLKSFATYGLVSPSPSPAISPTKERATNPLDDVTPSPSPSKRKRSVRDSRNDEGATNALENEMNSESDLATRVKNRKRLRSSSSLRPTE